mmetsp:Transcript_21310/g.37731  ORF Transcript_21310/g.37731 Transcript_21310/m.37731 type:complete len:260 (-) Transcript_21310:800-1579(-)
MSKVGGFQVLMRYLGVQFYVHVLELELLVKVPHRFKEFLLSWHSFRQIELAPNLLCRFKQCRSKASLGTRNSTSKTCWTGTNNRNSCVGTLRFSCGYKFELFFVACARVDKARSPFTLEDVVKTCLIASDAGVNFILSPFFGFNDKFRVCEKGSCHADHIRVAIRKDLLCGRRHVDSVGCAKRNRELLHELFGNKGEPCSRHAGSNRWNPSLMPANTSVNNRCTRFLDATSQQLDLFPVGPALHQVQHAETENDDEVLP